MTPPKGEEHVGRSSTIVQTFKSIFHTIAKISVPTHTKTELHTQQMKIMKYPTKHTLALCLLDTNKRIQHLMFFLSSSNNSTSIY